MGRPRTINMVLAQFCAESMRRFRKLQETDTKWVPNVEQAKVIKTLAETQVIIQRRKPESGDDEAEDEGKPSMSIEELERMHEEKPSAPPETDGDDDP